VADEKLAVRTADLIERRIIDNGWGGDRVIGSEAQLLEEFGVSRTVLREALLLLDQRQIATRRRGNGGGVLARRPELSVVARAVSLFLECEGVQADQILEARILLEESCVEQAIQNAPPEEKRALTEHARAGLKLSGERATAQMQEFHLRLARLSGSPIWAMFTQVLSQLARDLIARGNRRPSEQQMRAQFQQLVRVAEAIEAGDVAAGKAALRKFIEEVTNRYL